MKDRTRILRGGPLDGQERTWDPHLSMETMVECPKPSGGIFLDVVCYDHLGGYVRSEHPGSPIIERCGACSLCPGHRVGTGPSKKFQHGEHP